MSLLWRSNVVHSKRIGTRLAVDGLRGGIDLKLASEAEAADSTAMLFIALIGLGTLCNLVKADAWRGATTGEYCIVSSLVVDLFVVEIVGDAGAELGETLWAEAAAHVHKNIDVGTKRNSEDGKTPTVVQSVTLS